LFFWSPYVRSYEKKLIVKNKEYWDRFFNVTDGKQWIYVLHEAEDLFVNAVHKDIVAKALQERDKLPIASIMYGGACKQVFKELNLSFGISNNYTIHPDQRQPIISKIRTTIFAWFLSRLTYKNKQRLFSVTYRGIKCGDAIHDTILRMRGKNDIIFDCFDISIKEYRKFLKDTFLTIDRSFKFFQAKKPRYLLTSHPVFNWELIAAVSRRFGSEILYLAYDKPEVFVKVDLNQNFEVAIKTQNLIRAQIENSWDCELETESVPKVSLNSEQDFFIYQTEGKDGSHLYKELGMERGNKNVFIMLHCLSDAPRGSADLNVYSDYNEWFIETLRIIRDIPNINWIIREHPQASFYRQDNYVKRIFDENKTANMFWCDKNISGNVIRTIADYVVTCIGDVGIEYWAYGIPTVTVGETYYSDAGISYNTKSKEQYREILKSIEYLSPPSSESVKLAQKYIHLLKKLQVSSDELSMLFTDIFSKEIEGIKSGNWEEVYTTVRNEFCQKYMALICQNKLKNCKLYNKIISKEKGIKQQL